MNSESIAQDRHHVGVDRRVLMGLLLAVALQLLVLVGMYVKAAMPLWRGTEIKMKVLPVDPRSLFRGNYARLRYDISRIDSAHFFAPEAIRNGEVVYVQLAPGQGELYEFAGVSLEQPEDGIYLRGRVEERRYGNERQSFRVKYGIEAFFAPKEEALALESELRDGGVAVLMVAAGGDARLKEIVE